MDDTSEMQQVVGQMLQGMTASTEEEYNKRLDECMALYSDVRAALSTDSKGDSNTVAKACKGLGKYLLNISEFKDYAGELPFHAEALLRLTVERLSKDLEAPEAEAPEYLQALVYMWNSLSRAALPVQVAVWKSDLWVHLKKFWAPSVKSSLKVEILLLLSVVGNSTQCQSEKGFPAGLCVTDFVDLAVECYELHANVSSDEVPKCLYDSKLVDASELLLYASQGLLRIPVQREASYKEALGMGLVSKLCSCLKLAKHWNTVYSIISVINLTLDKPAEFEDVSSLRKIVDDTDFQVLNDLLSVPSPAIAVCSITAQFLYELINRMELFDPKSMKVSEKLSQLNVSTLKIWCGMTDPKMRDNEQVYAAAILHGMMMNPEYREKAFDFGVPNALLNGLRNAPVSEMADKQYQRLLYSCRGLMSLGATPPEQAKIGQIGVVEALGDLVRKRLPVGADFTAVCLLTNLASTAEDNKLRCLKALPFDELLKVCVQKLAWGCQVSPYLMLASNLIDAGNGGPRPGLQQILGNSAVSLLPVIEKALTSISQQDRQMLHVVLGLLRGALTFAETEALDHVSPRQRHILNLLGSHPSAAAVLQMLGTRDGDESRKSSAKPIEASGTSDSELTNKRCGNPPCGKVESVSPELTEVFKRCGGCKTVWYCCKECQTLHWKSGHKKECKA